jgi:exodeoxyribonuclease VII small subunit
MELSQLLHGKLKNVEEQLTKVMTEDGEEKDFEIQEEE